MNRSSRLKIMDPNLTKVQSVNLFLNECTRVINLFIDKLWTDDGNVTFPKFVNFGIEETWLSSRMQQCLGKQALEICKSQRKKFKKSKPIYKKQSINLDSRFIDIRFEQSGKYDTWIKLSSIGNKMILKLPTRIDKHKHFKKYFYNTEYELVKSVRLIKINEQIFFDIIFKKDSPKIKCDGESIGFDIGYKKLITGSNGKVYDDNLELQYEKISKKKQGSKSFKKSLKERDNKINKVVNNINLKNIKTVVVENLISVKKNSKGKIRKKFNSKLQRWSYSKVLKKLSSRCEEMGIQFIKIDPYYTSQMCSVCGSTDKKSRKGEVFCCVECGYSTDADYNASVNILHIGTIVPIS